MLKTRILTALVLAPTVLLVVLFAPDWGFRLAAAALMLVGCWEFRRLAGLSPMAGWLLFGTQLLLIGVAYYHWDVILNQAQEILIGCVILWGLMFIRLAGFDAQAKTGPRYRVLSFLSAWVAISGCWFALSWLRSQPQGEYLLLLLLFIIWAADVGAYFSGRFLGRTKLAPRISPKKTWEGVIGGILLAGVATLALSRFTPLADSSLLQLSLLTMATVMSSVAGDLFISLHKRSVGLKDAGNLFPGHGGVLDRFDSLLPGAVFFALAVWLLTMTAL